MGTPLTDRVDAAVHEMVEGGEIPGACWAVVAGAGRSRVVHVGAAGTFRRDTVVRVASLTKPLAGLLTAALAADGVLALDDPVERWVPEIAGRGVLRTPSSPLEDVEPAERPLTVVDVVGMGAGLGWGEAVAGSPLERAVGELELASTWEPSPLPPDEWVRRLGTLPMAHQPGRGWLYQMSYDLLTVVLERVTRTPVDELLHDRVLGPAGMTQTGWTVPDDQRHRVPAQFFPGEDGARVEAVGAGDPSVSVRPAFCSLATGLLSTAADLARLGELLLDHGRVEGARVVPGTAVPAMTRDLRGPEATLMSADMLRPDQGWGMGIGVDLRARFPGSHPGRFGWDGGTGTSMWTDPTAGVSAVLLTQHGMGGPGDADHLSRFWAAVHA